MEIERLTARNKDGLAYLVNVKPDEQEVDSPHKNTLQCILDCFERLAQYEDEAIARQSETEKREPCEWCEGNISKYFDVNLYDFTAGNIGVKPKVKFCPLCGRVLKE